MILATLDKFPSNELYWGDFLRRLHEDHGRHGLSQTTVYNFMRDDGIADFADASAHRPFRRLK
jgi:hypothetical protein